MGNVEEKDLLFVPEEDRAIYAQLINEGSDAATHVTSNDGNDWCIPDPDDALVRELVAVTLGDRQ